MSIDRHYTIALLARVMHRSRGSIHGLILSGRLQAYDANPDGETRQWRVTPEALDAFISRASIQQNKRTRRKVSPAKIKKFF